MDLVAFIKFTYLATTAGTIATSLIPVLGPMLMAYGFRSTPATEKEKKEKPRHDALAAFKVPHWWFGSFYVLSVTLSILWGQQLLSKGVLFQLVASWTSEGRDSMTLHQVIVTWLMMLVQGIRRVYESFAISKPSTSDMLIMHWILGALYYSSLSVCIWIEGVPILTRENFIWEHIKVIAPTVRTFFAVILFILASGLQHDCHVHLASLKKYTLPEHPAFSRLVCPHYFAECLIYTAIAIVAAPKGHVVNGTLLCVLVFVVANLGCTAHGSKKWYEAKFGKKSVASRWRMIPFLY